MFVHGGPDDIYNLMVTTLHWDVFATNYSTMLNEAGHELLLLGTIDTFGTVYAGVG